MSAMTLDSDTDHRSTPLNTFRSRMSAGPQYFLSPMFFILLVIVWEVAVRYLNVPNYILPTPSSIFVALQSGLSFDNFWGEERFYTHAVVTLSEAGLGFVIGSVAGILLGAIIAQVPAIEPVITPYVTGFQSLPKVAVAPLFVIWFGFGMTSKVLIVSLMVFFPLMINSVAGFKSVDRELLELMRSLSASRWQVFRVVQLPTALPYIFAGLEMGIVYSFLGAVVGEFVGGTKGLGVQVLQMNYAMDVSGMFAALILLATMGAVSSKILQLVRRRALYWAPSEHTAKE